MLNEHNTVFARSGPLYIIGLSLGPTKSSMQTVSRSPQNFLQGSLGDRQITLLGHCHSQYSASTYVVQRCGLIIIIVAYLGCYTGFHACIVIWTNSVIDRRLCFARGVESPAQLYASLT